MGTDAGRLRRYGFRRHDGGSAVHGMMMGVVVMVIVVMERLGWLGGGGEHGR